MTHDAAAEWRAFPPHAVSAGIEWASAADGRVAVIDGAVTRNVLLYTRTPDALAAALEAVGLTREPKFIDGARAWWITGAAAERARAKAR